MWVQYYSKCLYIVQALRIVLYSATDITRVGFVTNFANYMM